MSGDVLVAAAGLCPWYLASRSQGCTKHPIMHRAVCESNSVVIQSGNGAETEKN